MPVKNEKPGQPKRKMTVSQIVFVVFALLIIVSMLLSAVSYAL